jgi:hypothetical protein
MPGEQSETALRRAGCHLRLRHRQAECLGGLEVDDRFDFCDLLNWEVGWLVAFENAGGIGGKPKSNRRRNYSPRVRWARAGCLGCG